MDVVRLVRSLNGAIVDGPNIGDQLRLRFLRRERQHAVAALNLSGLVAGVSFASNCP